MVGTPRQGDVRVGSGTYPIPVEPPLVHHGDMEQATVTTNRRLERGDGPLAGVAAGTADYFGIDPTIVRLGLVAATVLGGPTVPIVYLAAWLIIPAAEEASPAPVEPVAPWSTAPPPPPAPPVPTPAAAPAPVDPVTDTLVADDETEVPAEDDSPTEDGVATEDDAPAGDGER